MCAASPAARPRRARRRCGSARRGGHGAARGERASCHSRLGVLLGRVEVRARGRGARARRRPGRPIRKRRAALGELAEELALGLRQRHEESLALPAEASTHPGCSMVAQRPCACSRATSASRLLASALGDGRLALVVHLVHQSRGLLTRVAEQLLEHEDDVRHQVHGVVPHDHDPGTSVATTSSVSGSPISTGSSTGASTGASAGAIGAARSGFTRGAPRRRATGARSRIGRSRESSSDPRARPPRR